MDDDDDLVAGLAGLAGLTGGHRALEVTLTRVADYAVVAIPGADGAGLALLEDDRPQTVVSTDDFVRRVDSVQYALGEGPCVSAVAHGRHFRSGNLGGDPRWPRFGPRAGRLGVHSILSLPLLLPEQAVGALNVYAHAKDAFDDHATALATSFAAPAAVSVFNAQLLARSERLAAQLQRALTSRAEIDQAIGVLMSRGGITADEAFARLRSMSQARSVKLVDVARELLGEASRRARARRAGDPTRAEPGAAADH